MTTKICLIISIFLFAFNLYMINESYDYIHEATEMMKRDGQFGMVYGFYGIAQFLNFIVVIPLLFLLYAKRKTQDILWFRISLVGLLFNPVLISAGWYFLD